MPYFFRKLEKRSQNLSSAAVVIGALRVNVRDYFSVLFTQLLCILFCTLSVVVTQKEVIKHLSTFLKNNNNNLSLITP